MRTGYRFDDILMLDLTDNILNFNYMGSYNELTLIKGYGYPIFVSLLNTLHIPYILGFNMLFISAALYFSNSLKNIKFNSWMRLIVFIFLLFNPIMVSKELMLLFYRNGFNIILTIIFFSSLLNIYYKTNVKNYIFVGLSYFFLIITREDFIWLLPALILILIFTKDTLLKKFIVPFIVVFLLIIISLLNYINYGAFTFNEMHFSQFSDTYSLISKTNNPERSLVDLRESVYQASLYSESFSPIYDKLVEYNLFDDDAYQPSYVFWGIRQAAGDLGYFESYQKSSELFKNIELELLEAEEFGNITFDKGLSLVVASTVDPLDLNQGIELFFEGGYNIVTFADVEISNGFTNTSDYKPLLNEVTNQETLDFEELATSNQPNINFLNIIKNIYSVINIILFFIAVISLVILIIMKENIIIELSLIGSALALLLGVVYFTITSYPAMSYYYLGPAYILVNLFSLISCFRIYELKLKDYIKKVTK